MNTREAYDLIQLYYDRMCRVSTTSGRRYNYEKIVDVMDECPEVEHYWRRTGAHRYVDCVIKIATYSYEEPKRTPKVKVRQTTKEIIDGGAYIVYLSECNVIKVGKSNNFSRRFTELERQYGELDVMETFNFTNEEDAYLMEVLLHKYFKEKYPNYDFIPQDRFDGGIAFHFGDDDVEILHRLAEKIKKENWF